MVRRRLRRLLLASVVAVVLALFVGQLLGQPILLGFVETESMESELGAGDGFVAIPDSVSGDPEPGDVVVFEAREIEGGGLTTHRIVDETDAGYVTRGDANPFTDQDGGEPPVQDEQIVATVWQVDGDVVAVPHFGTAILTVERGIERVQRPIATALGTTSLAGPTSGATLLFGLSALWYVLETVRDRRGATATSRYGTDDGEPIDPRYLCAGFAVLVVVAAAAAMLVPAGTEHYDVVSAEFDSDRPTVIERGTSAETTYTVANAGLVPAVSYVDSGENAVVEPDRTSVGPRAESELSVTITAPEETGYYPTTVTEYRYLRVLPTAVLDALYRLHPRLPFLAICAVLGSITYGTGRVLLGRVADRRRSSRRRRAREAIERR